MNFGARFRTPESADESAADFMFELPSDLDLIEATVNYLVGRCLPFYPGGSLLDLNFRVGVTEALANAILYGNRADPQRTVTVDVSLNAHRAVVVVADEGEGFDPDSVPDPTTPDNILATRGRGIFLIRQLMDEVEFNERGNELRMVLEWDSPPEES